MCKHLPKPASRHALMVFGALALVYFIVHLRFFLHIG